MNNIEWSSIGLGGWLVSPAHATDVEARLRHLHDQMQSRTHQEALHEAEMSAGSFWPEPGTYMSRIRPYHVARGVLTIPVSGVLLHQFPYAFPGMATGYEYIREALHRGLEDDEVETILLEVDSPGGVVSGCFDLADEIYSARSQKRVAAVCNEFAFSAAYALASAAETITVPRTGGVGSIGIIGTHVDLSKMFEGMGIKFNFVFAGKHKLDGRPERPLSDDARAGMQSRVDATYKIFVETVARNRGMKKSQVRETEAAIFTAPESVKNGLADEIAPFTDAVAALTAAPTTKERGDTMSKDKAAAKQAAPSAETDDQVSGATYTDADLETARADGAAAERERITAIMESEEAKSRPAAAKQVAFGTSMTVEEASSFLSGLPEEAKAESADSKSNAFESKMEEGNPEVGAGDPNGSNPKPDEVEGFFGSLGLNAVQ